jgi:hypothetical protein
MRPTATGSPLCPSSPDARARSVRCAQRSGAHRRVHRVVRARAQRALAQRGTARTGALSARARAHLRSAPAHIAAAARPLRAPTLAPRRARPTLCTGRTGGAGRARGHTCGRHARAERPPRAPPRTAGRPHARLGARTHAQTRRSYDPTATRRRKRQRIQRIPASAAGSSRSNAARGRGV